MKYSKSSDVLFVDLGHETSGSESRTKIRFIQNRYCKPEKIPKLAYNQCAFILQQAGAGSKSLPPLVSSLFQPWNNIVCGLTMG